MARLRNAARERQGATGGGSVATLANRRWRRTRPRGLSATKVVAEAVGSVPPRAARCYSVPATSATTDREAHRPNHKPIANPSEPKIIPSDQPNIA